MQDDWRADAVVHFGMHGTVEWLPGAPLGNTGFSWSDVLLGSMPNVYVYAANNPSESIIAKRRGYGTIVRYKPCVCGERIVPGNRHVYCRSTCVDQRPTIVYDIVLYLMHRLHV